MFRQFISGFIKKLQCVRFPIPRLQISVTTRYIMALENERKCSVLWVFLKLPHTLHIPAQALIYPEIQYHDNEVLQLVRMFQMLSNRDRCVIQAALYKMLDETIAP